MSRNLSERFFDLNHCEFHGKIKYNNLKLETRKI